MISRPLGASGIPASAVGLGTWAIGGWMWGGADERDAVAAVHAALDAGVTLIDTAPMYGFGASERLVGRAIADRRDRVVLASKCGLVWTGTRGEHFFNTDDQQPNPQGRTQVYRCLAPDSVRAELEASLRRLQTDVIDLYQTHWQESTTAVEDTMAELLRLKDEGKIRAIGCSNATPDQMRRYAAVGQLDADQELYSMLDRSGAEANLGHCAANGLAFLAYSPLAQGLLTGRMGPDRRFAEGDQRLQKPRFSVDNRLRIQQMLAEFEPIAAGYSLTLGQAVLAWTLAQPGCTHVLVGARDPRQAIENARAGAVTLSPADLRTMDAIAATHLPDIV